MGIPILVRRHLCIEMTPRYSILFILVVISNEIARPPDMTYKLCDRSAVFAARLLWGLSNFRAIRWFNIQIGGLETSVLPRKLRLAKPPLKFKGSLAKCVFTSLTQWHNMPRKICLVPSQSDISQSRHNERDGVSNHQPHDFYSTVYSGADESKRHSSASLAFEPCNWATV